MPSFLSNLEGFRGTGEVNEQGQALEQFLEGYNANKYEKPSVTADVLVFAYQSGQKDLLNEIKLLMVKRKNHPSIGFWAIPGGFAKVREDLVETAKRELKEETGLTDIPLTQMYTYGEVERDPRDRVVTTAYVGLVEDGTQKPVAADDAKDAKWWNVEVAKVSETEKGAVKEVEYRLTMTTQGERELTALVVEKIQLGTPLQISEYSVKESNGIAFDHARYIVQGYTFIERSPKNAMENVQVFKAELSKEAVQDPAVCETPASSVDVNGKRVPIPVVKKGNPNFAWYENASFYHIYPLGLCGAPKLNEGQEVTERLNKLLPWISHIKEIGCNGIYLGPVFESVGHGYETTDYKTVDRRLGTNETLRNFVDECHRQGIRVVLDGVFNHTGREFFAFKDIKEKREGSQYRDWYCNVNFGGNNEYNDGFSYENWGGYNLLVKLNQRNPAVIDYICNVIRFWVEEFDIDGIRLDAADVLDFEFMKTLRAVAREVKDQFWLMGEVIHGDYGRWVNDDMLHSVTNYQLHKALFSGHNDHNYFEIAHNVKYVYNQVNGNLLKLYNFLDNHDVDRIASKVNNKDNLVPIYYLLYTLPGVPSIYYGSEFAVEGVKVNGSDDGLRPELDLQQLEQQHKGDRLISEIAKLGELRQESEVLAKGRYEELMLTNRQFAFGRMLDREAIITVVNNDEQAAESYVPVHMQASEAQDIFTGEKVRVENGTIRVMLEKNSGRVFYVRG
ncbi:alpha-amylase family glycosyl hydrolase [[Clostridium] polysaccharolyticum]|uniref:Glycosidase n=1 Tax=[Clostridium] polysaccharolyticum TaxID=29364 RepID=A0A1I0D889_9FIRM|nr:alpha-amylase family glycosyl hydrolase [[Clostridium] polysaccharolyticum]SET28444.1 Glycosidase [[Clostridium] polysaccharolyticum]